MEYDKFDDSEYGKFGWVIDPEGNKVELWEPPAGQSSRTRGRVVRVRHAVDRGSSCCCFSLFCGGSIVIAKPLVENKNVVCNFRVLVCTFAHFMGGNLHVLWAGATLDRHVKVTAPPKE